MKLGIMQPYFFPYLGYFSLIKNTDKFILIDEVQYMHQGWIARNRILNPSGGWQYIIVPLKKHSQKAKIKDIFINNEKNWKHKIIEQIRQYKKIAKNYSEIFDLINVLFSDSYEDIVSLNKNTLEAVCSYLNISTPIEIFSQMDLEIEPVNSPDEWALNICKAVGGVDEYWNPPGGLELYDREKYKRNDIDLKFLNIKLNEYDQGMSIFEPGLSIIDAMMFNSCGTVSKMLDDYKLI